MRDRKLHKLAIGVLGIYVSYVVYAVFQEKLFSYEYPSTVVEGQKDKFVYSTSVVIFPTLVSFLYGTIKGLVEGDRMNHIPRREKALLGVLFFTSVMSANTALVYVSYPLQLLVRNLRLMAIFLVGCFCSRLKKTEGGGHLGYGKLLIGLTITIGVVIFNHFANEKKGRDKESHLIGYILLAISLVADGFFLDSQAYSKKMFKPTSNELFTYTNGIACLLASIYSFATGEFPKIIEFASTHSEVGVNILGMAFLGTSGQLFIYFIVKNFQPYVTAIITTVRKIITVLVSIVIFHHTLTPLQWVGVLFVFGGVTLELQEEMGSQDHHKEKHSAEQKTHTPGDPTHAKITNGTATP